MYYKIMLSFQVSASAFFVYFVELWLQWWQWRAEGGANGAPAPGIQGRGYPKQGCSQPKIFGGPKFFRGINV